MMCSFLISIETQTCFDDLRDEPPQDLEATKKLQKEEQIEQEDEMEAEKDNAKLDQSFENEDPSWTPEEVDAACKK